MKSKVLSWGLTFLLAACLLAGALQHSPTVYAAGPEYEISGNGFIAYDDNYNYITKAEKGQVVILFEDDAMTPYGYYLKELKSNDVSISRDAPDEWSFIMPGKNVTIEAVYELQKQYTIDLTGGGTVEVPKEIMVRLCPYGTDDDVDLDGDGNDDIHMVFDNIPGKGFVSYVTRLSTCAIKRYYNIFTYSEFSPVTYLFDSKQEPLTIDLSDGGMVAVPVDYMEELFPAHTDFDNDLDGDGKADVHIVFNGSDKHHMQKLSSTNLSGTYVYEMRNYHLYNPIIFIFSQPSYSLKTSGCTAYDSADNVITSSKANNIVIVRPDDSSVPSGKYCSDIKASSGDFSRVSPFDWMLVMPGNDVTLEAVYVDQKSYTVDLRSSQASMPAEVAFWLYPFGTDSDIDVDGDGTGDFHVKWSGSGDAKLTLLEGTNLAGEYNKKLARLEYGSFTYIFPEKKIEESSKEESKAEESKAEESKSEESKAEESKPEDSKAEESKPEESKSEESKSEGSKIEESKSADQNSKEESQVTPAKSGGFKWWYVGAPVFCIAMFGVGMLLGKKKSK